MKEQSIYGKVLERIIDFLLIILLRPKVSYTDKSTKSQLKNKPVIYIANHSNHLDAPLVSAVFRRNKPYILVTRKWYDKDKVGRIIRACRCVPIDLNSADFSWFANCEKILASGKSVIIFPQGKLHESSDITGFQPGAALLMIKTGASIVPLAIKGKYKKLFGERQKILVGKPLKYDCPENMRHSKFASQATKNFESEVNRLYSELK